MKKSLILTAAGALAIAAFSATADAGTIIDKGGLGQYERQGRFLKPLLTAAPRESAAPQRSTTAEGVVTVDKGEFGKYERHGRFLRPVMAAGQQARANAGRAIATSTVTHEHGLNGKEHRNIGRKRAF